MSELTSNSENQPKSLGQDAHLDPSLAKIAASLDQLGNQERSMPDAGFEARLLAAVPSVKQLPRLLIAGEAQDTSRVFVSRQAGASGSLWAMRLAAAVAIVSGLGAVWMATRTPSTPKNLIASSDATSPVRPPSQSNPDVPASLLAGEDLDEGDLLLAVAFGDESVEDLQDLRQVTESLEVSIDSRIDLNEFYSEEGATQ